MACLPDALGMPTGNMVQCSFHEQNMHVLILVRLNKNWYLGYHEYHVYIKINSSSDKVETEFEPRHDKTNRVSVRPAKTQINLGVRPV